MARLTARFVNDTWPEFRNCSRSLGRILRRATDRVIEQALEREPAKRKSGAPVQAVAAGLTIRGRFL